MKYRNATEVLPERLLKEVQKYVSGESLYFPKIDKAIEWGEASGARAYYRQRNAQMQEKFRQKRSLESLAEEYGLSVESVRKIVYRP